MGNGNFCPQCYCEEKILLHFIDIIRTGVAIYECPKCGCRFEKDYVTGGLSEISKRRITRFNQAIELKLGYGHKEKPPYFAKNG